jgi:hypothetical protein
MPCILGSLWWLLALSGLSSCGNESRLDEAAQELTRRREEAHDRH